MSLLFDAIIIIICALCVIIGAVRGFIKSVMRLGSGIASALVAYAFTPVIAPEISSRYLAAPIASGLRDTIASVAKNAEGSYDLSKLFADMPDAFNQILERYGADTASLRGMFGMTENAAEEAVNSLASAIAEPVANALATVLTFIVLFAGCFIALALITWILDLIFHLPVLKTANKVLGALFGVVLALVFTWLFSLVSIAFIHAMTPVYPEMFSQSVIDNSPILHYFATNNMIALFGGYFGIIA